MGFIDDQNGLLLFSIDFDENAPEGFGKQGDGEGTGLDLKGSRICLRSSRMVPVLAVTGMIRY